MAKFKYSLKGDARSWVKGKVYQDYDALKAAFLQQFSGFKAKGSDGFSELNYKMREPVEGHLQKLQRMAESLNYGDVLMDRFKWSLPGKVCVQLATMDGTLDEVATAAQEIVQPSQRRCTLQHSKVKISTANLTLWLTKCQRCLYNLGAKASRGRFPADEDSRQATKGSTDSGVSRVAPLIEVVRGPQIKRRAGVTFVIVKVTMLSTAERCRSINGKMGVNIFTKTAS